MNKIDVSLRNATIPKELQKLPQWARCSPEKEPLNLDGSLMTWGTPANWLTFEQVSRYDRIGFIISSEAGLVGVDFDGCTDENGVIHPQVKAWVDGAGTWAETSQSRRGLKMWLKGKIPNDAAIKTREVPWATPDATHVGIEIYGKAKFFAVTGDTLMGCPSEINEAPEVLNDILVNYAPAPTAPKKQPVHTLPQGNGYWSLNEWKAACYKYLAVVKDCGDSLIVICPWKREHTTKGDTCRIWYGPPHTINCFHGHCEERLWDEVKQECFPRKEQWVQYNPYQEPHGQNGNGNGKGHTPPEEIIPNPEYIPVCKKHVFEAKEVPLKDIRTCLDMQQLGDAQLFARCFEGQIAYDSFEKEWYLWQGHYWKRDMHDNIRVLVSGHLGSVYLRAAAPLNDERAQLDKETMLLTGDDDSLLVEKNKKLIKDIDASIKSFIHRAKELRGRSYNTGVLYFAESLLAIPTNEDGTSQWDNLVGKIGVRNGVLDLHTGVCRDGDPNDYIRTFSPTEWKGLEAQCPLFLKFLDALFELRPDKDEVIQFLIRLLGYALTGTCKEAIFAILYGPEGRNGKSTLFKIVMACIGKSLAGSIAKELLIDTGKGQQANGPKPDVLDLQGKRIAIAAETQKGDKLDVSSIKHYTGGDELGGRGVFGKHNIRFDPTHTLFLHTNFKPHADPGDAAFWARACLIEFNMRFIEEPNPNNPYERKYDTGLERHIVEEELSGVLACLVRGAMDYDAHGLKKPQSVKLDSEAYRVGEDTLQTFINDCCVVGKEHCIPSSAFIKAYGEWSGDGFKITSKELKRQMEKKGFVLAHTKRGSVYEGIMFVGEGNGDSKNAPVTKNDSNEKSCHQAPEADLDRGGDSSDSSLLKVPHEGMKSGPYMELMKSAVTAVTEGNFDGLKATPEAGLSEGDRKNFVVTGENLLSPNGAITTNLLLEYRTTYQQLTQSLTGEVAPDDILEWDVPESGLQSGQVSFREYGARLQTLGKSKDLQKIKAGLKEMQRKLECENV